MSSYARLQFLNSDSKQTTGQINLKPMQVTPAGLEVIEEASTTYEFLVSEASSQTNLKTDYRNIRDYNGVPIQMVASTLSTKSKCSPKSNKSPGESSLFFQRFCFVANNES